ncbi:hypothetical protein [Finegoldia magna]|jgi:hypothetical protein|uniref:hypothetical protein n=1 Tax=Finegoldia magna TaxID=1260 RepID=UPI001D154BCE|nr:hypothetical protein [Finegoldia magna]UEB33945.1 hypothetical protein LK404_03180 [Finegoldia magna]
MKIFSVNAQIVATEDCMDKFYDNNPENVINEIKRIIWKMYDTRNEGMVINRLKVELDEV